MSKNLFKKGKHLRQNSWKYWYPRKEHKIDKDVLRLEKIFQKNKVFKILDAGCGTGRHLIYFAKKGYIVFGFDFSSYAIKETKKKLREKNLKAHLRVWDIQKKFPYPDQSFDAVLCIRAFHHFVTKTIKRIAEEFTRVTKAGGYMYIQVPTLHRVLKHARMAERRGKAQIGLEKGTYLPKDGPEKGIPHHGFTQTELGELFGQFRIKSIKLKDEHYNLLSVKKYFKNK